MPSHSGALGLPSEPAFPATVPMQRLVEAGADSWTIYTRAELQTLCVQNRVAPLTAAELRKVHEIKRAFDGRITK
jgi:hypothetical protein